jgi:ASC-1-like (ASCH) protein
VGTQINGAPHIGTNLVQAAAFALARLARRRFSLSTSVQFVALDNAPHEVILDPEAHHAYQKTYFHALGSKGVEKIIGDHYSAFFESLSDATDAEYEIETYTSQQKSPEFRETFLQSLDGMEDIRWWLAPSHGSVHLRVPCPECGWAEKRGERTQIVRHYDCTAVISAECFDHGEYEVEIGTDGYQYLDLNTLYRNLVKERSLLKNRDTLYVMVKGGDWVFGCQLVDGAHAAMGALENGLPIRVFVPQILSQTGAKLSKSLLNDPTVVRPVGITDWMLDSSRWKGTIDQYVDTLLWVVERCADDPKDFFRSFTTEEIARVWKMARQTDGPRMRSMPIYKRFFDMIAAGSKTIEIRVAYSSMKKIQVGQGIRFECRAEQCLTRVKRVAEYKSFEEMLASENLAEINPTISKEDQLRELRRIFPPDKEALGVLAIEVEKISG